VTHNKAVSSEYLLCYIHVLYLGPECLLDNLVLVLKCPDTLDPPEQCRSVSVPISLRSEVYGYHIPQYAYTSWVIYPYTHARSTALVRVYAGEPVPER